MEAVLDASALLAWWLPETPESRACARRVAEAGRAGAIYHAPYIFENEIATGLLRAMRSRRIDLDTMHIALGAIETIEVRVHYNPYTSRTLIEMAGHYHLQVADALYFHLAQVLGLPIATLDGGLRTAAKAHGVKLFAG